MWVVSAARGLRRVSAFDSVLLCNNYQYSTRAKYDNDDSERIEKINFFTNILNQYEINQQNQSKKIDWNEITQALLSAKIATESNVNAYILNRLSKEYFDKADHFVDYLRSSNNNLNVGTVGSIFKCFARMNMANNYKSVNIQEKFILELYNELTSKYKILDPATLEHCVSALSHTERWRDCIDLLERIKVACKPSALAINSIIISAFKRNDPEIGWKFLTEATHKEKELFSASYIACIDYYIKKFGKDSKQLYASIEKLLDFIIENNMSLDKEAAERVNEVFESHFGWTSHQVEINRSGKCPSCKSYLTNFSMSPDDIKKLKEAFFKDVMINKNVFLHSNPQEITNFLKFIDDHAPFDMVIDGLNVAYSVPKIKSPVICSKLLSAVIENVLESGKKKILLLGRNHMNKWKTKNMDYVRKFATCYFVDDLSYDDTFILYAALSGNLTDFMSRDLMRSHKYLLTEERNLFSKWQRTHQHSLIHASPEGKVFIKRPLKYLLLPQKQLNWHIPYSEDKPETENSNENITSWMCLKPKSKSKNQKAKI